MKISYIDHLVLTVTDIEETCRFYSTVLGMEVITFSKGRKALAFGRYKINLHQSGKEFEPKAFRPTPGAADFCLITAEPVGRIVDRVRACNVLIEEGPVARTGATGPIISVYIRDPDGNLVEISTYQVEEESKPQAEHP